MHLEELSAVPARLPGRSVGDQKGASPRATRKEVRSRGAAAARSAALMVWPIWALNSRNQGETTRFTHHW